MTIQDIIKKNLMLRYKILKTLYEYEAQDKSFSYEDFGNENSYSNDEVRNALKFLKGELLINYDQTILDFISVELTSHGSKLVEEIEQAKNADKSTEQKVISWVKDNVSWIAPIIVDLLKGQK